MIRKELQRPSGSGKVLEPMHPHILSYQHVYMAMQGRRKVFCIRGATINNDVIHAMCLDKLRVYARTRPARHSPSSGGLEGPTNEHQLKKGGLAPVAPCSYAPAIGVVLLCKLKDRVYVQSDINAG